MDWTLTPAGKGAAITRTTHHSPAQELGNAGDKEPLAENPILTYCVSLAADAVDTPASGIGQAPVLMIEAYGLHCWYSQVEEQAFTGEERVRRAALEFHRFVTAAFSSAAVLPFRFPTILDSEDELRDLLDEKAHSFASTLGRMEGLAQFEVRILRRIGPEATTQQSDDGKVMAAVRSGERAIMEKAGALIRDSHRREMPHGVRLYLLTEKLMTSSLRDAVKEIILPEGVEARLQGPWPPTEFLLDENEL